MQRVQAICDRVIVINQGEIVADDKVANLLKRQSHVYVVVEFEGEVNESELLALDGVESVTSMRKGYTALRLVKVPI